MAEEDERLGRGGRRQPPASEELHATRISHVLLHLDRHDRLQCTKIVGTDPKAEKGKHLFLELDEHDLLSPHGTLCPSSS